MTTYSRGDHALEPGDDNHCMQCNEPAAARPAGEQPLQAEPPRSGSGPCCKSVDAAAATESLSAAHSGPVAVRSAKPSPAEQGQCILPSCGHVSPPPIPNADCILYAITLPRETGLCMAIEPSSEAIWSIPRLSVIPIRMMTILHEQHAPVRRLPGSSAGSRPAKRT